MVLQVTRYSVTYKEDTTHMAFIHTRKLKYDAENRIVSSTAAIIESHYISGNVANHSQQEGREELGKVIEMYSNKCGLFLSPTWGCL